MIRDVKEMPLLSVLVPVYNVEPYIERCIKSIINQTYRYLEIIFVDDGSTDDSGKILDHYEKMDPRICVIHKKNGGIVSARKEAVKNAHGEYIAVVDSDDWIESTMFEEMMKTMIQNDADIVTSGCIRDYGNHQVVDPDAIPAGVYEGETLYKDLLASMISTEYFFQSNISIHLYNKIYKRDCFEKYQMLVDENIIVGDDAACVYPCLLNAQKIVVLDKSYYHYCIREQSTMGSIDKKEDLFRYELLFEHLKIEFLKHIDRVPNILEQWKQLKAYLLLLRLPQLFVKYQDGILIPFGKVDRDERILLYGKGKFGNVLKDILTEDGWNIVAQVDKKDIGAENELDISFDKVIIAVLLYRVRKEIYEELIDKKWNPQQILFADSQMLDWEINAREIEECM